MSIGDDGVKFKRVAYNKYTKFASLNEESMNPTALVCAYGSIDNALIRTDLAFYQLSSRHGAFQFSAHLVDK